MTVTNSKRWYRRPSRVVPLAIAALIVIVLVVSLVSPWPAALLIRALFESNANSTVAEMKPYVPTTGLEQKLNIHYGTDGADTSLDWFAPAGTTEPLPVVVWIHGGAWISGSKENVDPYAKILASHGYVAVSLNYSIAPGAIYPTALAQLNSALAFLNANAARFHIDPTRFVIAGDSAGAQLTAQLATMITSPAYATKVGLTPALSPSQLSGVVLDCGIYDVSGIPNAPGIGGWGFRTALWAYLGVKDWAHTAGGEQMSTLDDVTAEFPTTWISGGNGDPLTKSQSQKFAARLTTLGVKVTSVFYPDDHTPSLPHEYQFHLKLADARAALASTVDFLGRITRN